MLLAKVGLFASTLLWKVRIRYFRSVGRVWTLTWWTAASEMTGGFNSMLCVVWLGDRKVQCVLHRFWVLFIPTAPFSASYGHDKETPWKVVPNSLESAVGVEPECDVTSFCLCCRAVRSAERSQNINKCLYTQVMFLHIQSKFGYLL